MLVNSFEHGQVRKKAERKLSTSLTTLLAVQWWLWRQRHKNIEKRRDIWQSIYQNRTCFHHWLQLKIRDTQ